MQGKSSKESSDGSCKILVVDDVCRSRVVRMLRPQYKVVTVKSPGDALVALRTQKDEIDLILTELNFPQMSGLQLQRQINEEFNLPVIIMSSDGRKTTKLECLERGAVFYLTKPISRNELKDVWQHSVRYKKEKSILIKREEGVQGMSSSSSREKTSYYADDFASADGSKKKYGKTKYSKNSMECLQGDNSNVAPKKVKLVWTPELKDLFSQAIENLTPEKAAQPMNILKYMNKPGLTRENVSSHLQKYRISLKKKKEKGASAASNYGSGKSSLPSENSEKEGNKQIGTSSQLTCGNNYIGSLNPDKLGPRHGASSDNNVSPLGLSGNQANIGQSYSSYTNSLHQANSTNFGVAGGMSRGPASGSNTMEMHQQQSLARNFGLYNALNPWLNYNGMQLADERELFGSGQTRLNGYGIHGRDGLTNGAQNNNMSTVGGTGVPAAGYSAPGESSYSGFCHANYYQDPPARGGVNEQGNTSVQQPLQPQQQYGELGNGGQTDFAYFNLMNDDFGNSVHPNPFGEGDISGYPSGPTNYQIPSQQQGGEGVLNLPSSSDRAEVSYQSNILNSNLFAKSTVEENIDRWNAAGHPSPNMEDVIREINHYHPSSNPNPNDQDWDEFVASFPCDDLRPI